MTASLRPTVEGRAAFVYTGARAFDPALPCAVFIHGAGMDHSVWVLPCRYFARHGINALAVDLPAHGRSRGDPKPTIEGLADWVVACLDALGVARAAVVGHSMGSLVAFDVARRHGARARSLSLIGSALPMAVGEPLLDASKADGHDAIDMLTYWGYSKSAQIGGNANPGMWMVGGTLRLLERAAPGVLHADLRACNDYRIDADSEPPVETEALLILGDRDAMTPPRNSAPLKKLLPTSRTTILKGSGHSLMMERPNPLLDALITVV